MKHFDRKAWIDFKNGELPFSLRIVMEDHLAICGQCRNIFLELFGPDDLRQAETRIPDGFTAAVLSAVRPEKTADPANPPVLRGWRDWLVYYVAASVVTLALVHGGVFQLLLENTPRIAARPPQLERPVGAAALTWADAVTGKLAVWISDFEAVK